MMFGSEEKMNSNLQNCIESLNQASRVNPEIDTVELEINQRKIEVELITRRKQVKHLRDDIDTLNVVNNDLKKNLEVANGKILNLEAEVRSLRLSCEHAEADLKNTSFIDKKRQYENMMVENTTLKATLEKSELEKRKLQRQVEDYTSQHDIYAANCNELLHQDQKIRSMIENYKKIIDEMGKLKDKVIAIYNKMGEFNAHQSQLELMKQKLETSNSAYNNLEEQYLLVQAKLNMFEDLLINYALPRPKEVTDLENYYIQKAENLESHLKVERELILEQQGRLNKEIVVNVSLCDHIVELEKKIEMLEKKLKNTEVKNDNNTEVIKNSEKL